MTSDRGPARDASAAITGAVAAVRSRIAAAARAAGRDPGTVRLVVVTKGQTPDVLPALRAAGVECCGEHRIDHLEQMRAAASDLRFAYIGRVQSRQLPAVVRLADSLHSLADPSHLDRLVAAVHAAGKAPFPVFVQVNLFADAAKAGGGADQAASLVEAARRHAALEVCGLMTMAPLREASSDQALADGFAATAVLAKRLGLSRLSMGMSGDVELAIAHGATDVRIGTACFPPSLQQSP